MVDRIGDVRVAWPDQMGPDAGPEVPDKRSGAWARDARRTAARLKAVLEAYALIVHEHHGSDLAALLHRGAHVGHAEQQLRTFVRDLLREGAAIGQVRDDVAPEELASYCLHAVAAARHLPTRAAVRRLVGVVLAGLSTHAESL